MLYLLDTPQQYVIFCNEQFQNNYYYFVHLIGKLGFFFSIIIVIYLLLYILEINIHNKWKREELVPICCNV